MTHDLSAIREAILHGKDSAGAAFERCEAAAASPDNQYAYIRRFGELPRTLAESVDRLRHCGAPLPALAGLPVSVKDLFDVSGHPTTAGSMVLRDAAPATADATAVARLREAGAALTGHTQMSEFAFSGVGYNPHFGTPLNPATKKVDGLARIPGGSSSGAAVTVASGAALAALGSDTGGSIRIPAALQGLVGFKSTSRCTPLHGTIPLSPTLDTACAITLSVRDSARLHGVLTGRPAPLAPLPLHALRLGVPKQVMFDGVDQGVAAAFTDSLERLSRAGARITEVDLPELNEPARFNQAGGFPAAESFAWHRSWIHQRSSDYDPRVLQRILRGEKILAADHLDLIAARADWIHRMAIRRHGFDAWLSPTVPVVAPLMSDIESDEDFVRINALLLRNTALANFLDGCALSMPCQRPNQLPVGLMLWSCAGQDQHLLNVAASIEPVLASEGTA